MTASAGAIYGPAPETFCRLPAVEGGQYPFGMAKLVLDKVLKRKKLSKRQFAKRLEIDYAAVFRYFRAGYDPKLSTLEKWSRAIGCRIRDLFEE
jgi:DNA-binding Xre family transcriptional regulator